MKATMMDKKEAAAIVGSEIYTFLEGKMWIAAWRRFDVIAQGTTETEALERLLETIAWQAIFDAEEGSLKSFGSAPVVSNELFQKWRRSHEETHSKKSGKKKP